MNKIRKGFVFALVFFPMIIMYLAISNNEYVIHSSIIFFFVAMLISFYEAKQVKIYFYFYSDDKFSPSEIISGGKVHSSLSKKDLDEKKKYRHVYHYVGNGVYQLVKTELASIKSKYWL